MAEEAAPPPASSGRASAAVLQQQDDGKGARTARREKLDLQVRMRRGKA